MSLLISALVSPCIHFVSEPTAHFRLPIHAYWVSSHLFVSTRIISVSLLISYHLCVLTDFCVPASSYYFYRLLCSSVIGKLLQMSVFLYHFTAPAVFYVPVSSHCHYWFVFPTNPLVPADFCVPVSSLYSADYFVPVSSPCCTDFCVPVSSLCACWFLCTRFISLPLLISCVLVALVG